MVVVSLPKKERWYGRGGLNRWIQTFLVWFDLDKVHLRCDSLCTKALFCVDSEKTSTSTQVDVFLFQTIAVFLACIFSTCHFNSPLRHLTCLLVPPSLLPWHPSSSLVSADGATWQGHVSQSISTLSCTGTSICRSALPSRLGVAS